MPNVKIGDDRWCRCGNCGHKLGKIVGVWNEQLQLPAIEIKCHSCKALNYMMIGGQGNDRASETR